MLRIRQIIIAGGALLSSHLAAGQAFTNGDLNGTVNFVSVPTSWTQIPETDPICLANTPPEATVDVLDAAGPNQPGGIAGIPFSGTTFCSGLHATDNGAFLWHEGIQQTVNGFTPGNTYSISFYQTVVQQQNCIDPTGSWRVYIDATLIGTSAPSTTPVNYDDINLVWDCRIVTFTATAGTHTIKFIPWDDDADQTNSAGSPNGGLRMGIDLIQFTTPVDPTITPVGPFCPGDPAVNLTAVDPGGTWSGTGITDVNAGTFDPSVAGGGNHEIVYTLNSGCGNITDTITITVSAGQDAGWTAPIGLCTSDAPVDLSAFITGTPGGTWSGTGMTGSMFDPSVGTQSITYSIGVPPCNADSTLTITVSTGGDATITPAGPFCDSDPVVILTAVDPGGTWTASCGACINAATGAFDPAAAGSGSWTITYTIPGACGDTDNETIVVDLAPVADAGLDASVCDGSSVTLNGSGGGTVSWSPAAGLSATNILNPVATPAATTVYTLTLTQGSCVSTDNVTVNVIIPTPLNLTADTTICVGDCATLNVSGGDFFVWDPDPAITDSSLTTQTVCPAATTTYSVTSYTVGTNLITNGDFSAGNTGFTSSYTHTPPPNSGAAQYFIGPNPQLFNAAFSPCVDNTTGAGNMMQVNGATAVGVDVWCQTIPVSPNTDYMFSAWITSLFATSPAILQFTINGVPIGANFSPNPPNCTWQEFFNTWNSGANTSATICIVNQNTAPIGNDFGIDDISFSPICVQTGSVTVTVTNALDATISPAGPFCANNAAANLAAVDPGGAWSGTGITDPVNGTFDPSVAGVGTHTITYTIPGACGATDTEDIVVIAAFDATITPAGPFCANDPVFTMTAVDPTGTWTATCGACINAATGDFDPAVAGAGTWDITYTIAGACGDTHTEQVVVTNQQDATVTPAGPFCDSDPVQMMTAVDPGGTWSSSCGACIDPVTGVFDPGVAGVGVHTVTYGIAGNCGDTASTSFDVFATANASITPVGPFCTGNPSVFLVGADPGGTWSGPGIIDPVTGEFDPAIAGGGTHVITYTIAGPCGNQETTTIVVNDALGVVALADQTICEGGSANISALPSGGDGNYVYAWVDGAANPVGGTQTITVSPVATTTYTVTLSDGCGSNTVSASVTITVEPLPTVNFVAGPVSGCAPLTVTFTDNSAPPGTICLWDFGDSFTSQDCGMTTHTYTADGCHDVTLTVTTAAGCTNSLTQPNAVCVTPVAQAAFTFTPESGTIFEPQIDFTNLSSNATSYMWDFGDGNTSTDEHPSHSFDGGAGTYNVCLIASNVDGCDDTTCQQITIEDEFLIYVPNAFTPDGVGPNNIFQPVISGVEPDSYVMTIFDRWGHIVFETYTVAGGWDGRDPSGVLAKEDVYVWKIGLKNAVSGERKEYIGHVTLLK